MIIIISGQKPGQGGSGAEESVFDGWKSDKWPFSAETEGQRQSSKPREMMMEWVVINQRA